MYHNLLTIYNVNSRTGRIRNGTPRKVIGSLHSFNHRVCLHIIDAGHIIFGHVTSVIEKPVG